MKPALKFWLAAISIILMTMQNGADAQPAKEITTPDGFINAKKISLAELKGKKVVLLDFWTYSCINCQRTIPFLNAWHEKYHDKGLVIIGVHTPEFDFEKKYENVLSAVNKFGIKYPVVLDNDHSTWNAYGNLYWPRKALIGIDGTIVYGHVGEGNYDETEKKIQAALKERLEKLGLKGEIAAEMAKPQLEETVDFSKVESPEIYFGASRNNDLGNGIPHQTGNQKLSSPKKVERNKLYLVGSWDFQNEYAQNLESEAKVIFRYKARNVYLVASAEKETAITVLRDGRPWGKPIAVKDERLYKLIQDPRGYGEHTLEIRINAPWIKLFAFTFG